MQTLRLTKTNIRIKIEPISYNTKRTITLGMGSMSLTPTFQLPTDKRLATIWCVDPATSDNLGKKDKHTILVNIWCPE